MSDELSLMSSSLLHMLHQLFEWCVYLCEALENTYTVGACVVHASPHLTAHTKRAKGNVKDQKNEFFPQCTRVLVGSSRFFSIHSRAKRITLQLPSVATLCINEMNPRITSTSSSAHMRRIRVFPGNRLRYNAIQITANFTRISSPDSCDPSLVVRRLLLCHPDTKNYRCLFHILFFSLLIMHKNVSFMDLCANVRRIRSASKKKL